MLVENLPFRVIRVSDQNDLNKVTQLRHEAYARHLPQFAQTLTAPEPADYDSDNLVLLAVAKDDGAPLATMRIHTNRNKPLPLEQAVTLPDAMRSATLAEAVRFSVANTRKSGGVAYHVMRSLRLIISRALASISNGWLLVRVTLCINCISVCCSMIFRQVASLSLCLMPITYRTGCLDCAFMMSNPYGTKKNILFTLSFLIHTIRIWKYDDKSTGSRGE